MVNVMSVGRSIFSTRNSKRNLSRAPRTCTIESLENRCVLSGVSPIPDVPDDAVVEDVMIEQHAALDGSLDCVGAHQQTNELNLSIVGTAISFDANTGLPAHLEGQIYYVGGPQEGDLAGTYVENVVPIIHPDFGFIGTTGVSVFSFVRPDHPNGRVVGDLTSINLSFIIGMNPSGGILVQSTGVFASGTGVFEDVTGGFTSSSTIYLPTPAFPQMQFALNVDLQLNFETLPDKKFLVWSGMLPKDGDHHDGCGYERNGDERDGKDEGFHDRDHHERGHTQLVNNEAAAAHKHEGHLVDHHRGSQRLDTKAADRILACWSNDPLQDESWPAALVA